jgi:uncharacterized membrane protein
MDCHLCDQAKEHLDSLQSMYPHQLKVVDVDSSTELLKDYGLNIPVVEVGPYSLKAPFTRQDLQMTLGAASDRNRHIQEIDRSIEQTSIEKPWTAADSFTYWLACHYLAILNTFVFVFFIGLPFLAPTLMELGLVTPAKLIYKSYSITCHQLPYRSWFLFGEQGYYPRAAANLPGVMSFGEATGLSEGDTIADRYKAREFVGEQRLGYKAALCERDVAIYGGILAFGLLFALTGRRIPRLPWYFWLLIGILPVAIDGLSQLISQPPISLFAYRESTPFLRTITGFLFGFTTAWFGYVYLEESMAETREIMEKRLVRSHQRS